jgi:transcriptional regulator with XRE-family HTH domain
MSREELIKSQEYWMVTIQTELFNHVRLYLEENKMTQTQFAAKMGVSKGYISQIMNGNFNHSLSKLIELSLAIGKMPVLKFDNFETRKEVSLNQMPSPSA